LLDPSTKPIHQPQGTKSCYAAGPASGWRPGALSGLRTRPPRRTVRIAWSFHRSLACPAETDVPYPFDFANPLRHWFLAPHFKPVPKARRERDKRAVVYLGISPRPGTSFDRSPSAFAPFAFTPAARSPDRAPEVTYPSLARTSQPFRRSGDRTCLPSLSLSASGWRSPGGCQSPGALVTDEIPPRHRA